MTDLQVLVRDCSGAAASSPPPSPDHRHDLVSGIAEMLGRQFAVYSAHRLSALAIHLEMPLNDLKALELIMALESISTGHLAQVMGVSSGGITALINRLEAAGYVERGRHPLDRRIIVIRARPGSHANMEHLRGLVDDFTERSATRYDVDQLETVQAFLAQCAGMLKDETDRWMASGHVVD
jgi:DNA-binding MarR family transcriptional regulator